MAEKGINLDMSLQAYQTILSDCVTFGKKSDKEYREEIIDKFIYRKIDKKSCQEFDEKIRLWNITYLELKQRYEQDCDEYKRNGVIKRNDKCKDTYYSDYYSDNIEKFDYYLNDKNYLIVVADKLNQMLMHLTGEENQNRLADMQAEVIGEIWSQDEYDEVVDDSENLYQLEDEKQYNKYINSLCRYANVTSKRIEEELNKIKMEYLCNDIFLKRYVQLFKQSFHKDEWVVRGRITLPDEQQKCINNLLEWHKMEKYFLHDYVSLITGAILEYYARLPFWKRERIALNNLCHLIEKSKKTNFVISQNEKIEVYVCPQMYVSDIYNRNYMIFYDYLPKKKDLKEKRIKNIALYDLCKKVEKNTTRIESLAIDQKEIKKISIKIKEGIKKWKVRDVSDIGNSDILKWHIKGITSKLKDQIQNTAHERPIIIPYGTGKGHSVGFKEMAQGEMYEIYMIGKKDDIKKYLLMACDKIHEQISKLSVFVIVDSGEEILQDLLK